MSQNGADVLPDRTEPFVPLRLRLVRRLGPGLITGAADDDPSGIATYSQVGAQFGYGLAWTMLFSLPFMIAIQEISGRIGAVTGRGIAENLRRHYHPGLVRSVVTLLVVALFFWQAALEVEDQRGRKARPLCLTPGLAKPHFARIRADTIVGMGMSNVIALCIIYATAATLHAAGMTDIQTSSQAAEALRPIAGAFTFVVFAAGILGTGLLGVPVLAGSAAYAVAEAFAWREGLDLRPAQAKWFYAVIAGATLAGVGLNFTPLDPVKALYWSAVVNGLLAAPVMAAVMLIASNGRIMGRLTLNLPMWVGGWAATAIMAAASIGFFVL